MEVNEIIFSYYQSKIYQNLLHIPHSKYTHLQTCKILTKTSIFLKIYFFWKIKNWKKAKLRKAKTNDLMWAKYANKIKLKLPISTCLVSPSPTYIKKCIASCVNILSAEWNILFKHTTSIATALPVWLIAQVCFSFQLEYSTMSFLWFHCSQCLHFFDKT